MGKVIIILKQIAFFSMFNKKKKKKAELKASDKIPILTDTPDREIAVITINACRN